MIANTIAVMTKMPEHRNKWREMVAQVQQNAQEQGYDWQSAVDFLTAILAILDGQTAFLSADHTYEQALTAIQSGIAREKEHL